ncbi:MAG TPA: hypothetical protein PLH93_09095, partial [Flavobacteriales bacterium]|nr:hypothetical protein [Flavobacteriales bacterium]
MNRHALLPLAVLLLTGVTTTAQERISTPQRSVPSGPTRTTPSPSRTTPMVGGSIATQPARTVQNGRSDERVVTERGTPTTAPPAMHLDPARQDLPFHHEVRPLGMGTTSFSAHLTNTTYIPMIREEVEALPGLEEAWTQPLVATRLATQRKQPMAVVDIYPYRRNTGTGQWERLSSYTLSIVEGRGGGPPVQPKSYPPTSRLASGEWYRVQVVQDGVYALTYEQLQNMGLAGEVPSDQVNLYGRHHGMLPFENDQLPPTDLVPNAVIVEDGGDGTFGPGDRVIFLATGPHRWTLDSGAGRFRHTKHVFSDSASYFVGIGIEPALRVSTLPEVL